MKSEEILRREREYRFMGEVFGTRFLVYTAMDLGESRAPKPNPYFAEITTSEDKPSGERATGRLPGRSEDAMDESTFRAF